MLFQPNNFSALLPFFFTKSLDLGALVGVEEAVYDLKAERGAVDEDLDTGACFVEAWVFGPSVFASMVSIVLSIASRSSD